MAFDVPVSKNIPRVILFGASNLNLLEAPLRQIDISGSEVAAQGSVSQSESSSEGSEFAVVSSGGITHNLNSPVVLFVTNCQISVR